MTQCHSTIDPSVSSQSFRTKLAGLISPLRRVRSRSPFFQLAAHRIPTLWSLYRGLLRAAPTDDIKWRIRKIFEMNQHRTGTEAAIKRLNQGYKWLDIFTKAKESDERLQSVLTRYSRLIVAKREKEHWKQVLHDEIAWQTKLRNRPILTGAFMRPSFYNGPLPIFTRQPHHIHIIISKRRRARMKRLRKQRHLAKGLNYLDEEAKFENALRCELGESAVPAIFSGPARSEWAKPIRDNMDEINESYARDNARSKLPFPPQLVEQVIAARRTKIEYNTRKRERERRGEVFQKTLERKRKGPPAHILARMTEKQKKIDRVIRSPSEAGYVAMVKRNVGMKLKDNETWKREDGDVKNREMLDRIAKEVREENERRRKSGLGNDTSSTIASRLRVR